MRIQRRLTRGNQLLLYQQPRRLLLNEHRMDVGGPKTFGFLVSVMIRKTIEEAISYSYVNGFPLIARYVRENIDAAYVIPCCVPRIDSELVSKPRNFVAHNC